MSEEFSASGQPGSLLPGTLDLTPPKVNRPRLKKGDRVSLVRGGCTTWVVTDMDDDGNGTLEPAPEAAGD